MKPEKRPSPAWKHTWAAFQKEGNLLGLVTFWVLTGLGECDFEGVRSAKSPTGPSQKDAADLWFCCTSAHKILRRILATVVLLVAVVVLQIIYR